MLEADINTLIAAGAATDREAARAVFAALRDALSAGTVRAAEPDSSSPVGWRVNTWVKQGILLGFKFGDMVDVSMITGGGRSTTRTRCLSSGRALRRSSASYPAARRSATARTSHPA